MTNKKFTAKNILTFVLVCLLVVSCALFSGCNRDGSDLDSTAPSTESATNTDTETTTQAATTTLAQEESTLTLKSEYKPYAAYDDAGEKVEIDLVYGRAYSTYGGALCFLEDGTFTTYIGVYANPDDESGTYKVISETVVEMSYNNDSVETATVTETDSNGNVIELRMPHRGFDVVFR